MLNNGLNHCFPSLRVHQIKYPAWFDGYAIDTDGTLVSVKTTKD
jgi:hypothetical protein